MNNVCKLPNGKEMTFSEYEKHIYAGDSGYDFQFYSDWHKDIFGFRPRMPFVDNGW